MNASTHPCGDCRGHSTAGASVVVMSELQKRKGVCVFTVLHLIENSGSFIPQLAHTGSLGSVWL